MTRDHLEPLETAINHRFANREILRRALTHSSHVHERGLPENRNGDLRDNEQLEFLGDSVLGFLISEALVARFPDYPEGRLSKMKAHLVSATYLHGVAEKLALGQYLELGRGEEMSGGRAKKTLLVNALEALIAAIYLDGGIEVSRAFVMRAILDGGGASAFNDTRLRDNLADFKTALQELARSRKLPPPRYVILKERGPEHSKTFTIEVRVGRDWSAQAEGYSKKNAAQNAAREIFEKLTAAPADNGGAGQSISATPSGIQG